jgi:hypothetical protein
MLSLAGLQCKNADTEALFDWSDAVIFVFQKSFYLGVYYEDLAHRNPNLEVAKLICISIPKSSIERMRVGRKQCFDSLLGTVDQYIIIFSKSTKIIQDFFFLLDFVCVPRSTSYSPLGMRS